MKFMFFSWDRVTKNQKPNTKQTPTFSQSFLFAKREEDSLAYFIFVLKRQQKPSADIWRLAFGF